MVAQDLLVLDSSVAIRVYAVGPGDEALVEDCSGALEESPIGRVADQYVAEAVAPLQRELRLLGLDELLPHQRFEQAGDVLPDALGDELLDRALGEDLPDDAAPRR